MESLQKKNHYTAVKQNFFSKFIKEGDPQDEIQQALEPIFDVEEIA